MIKTVKANLDVVVEASATLKLESPDISMDDAQSTLEKLGNEILERDDEARTFVVLNTKDHPMDEVWCCDYCDAYSKSEQVIINHEKECQYGR